VLACGSLVTIRWEALGPVQELHPELSSAPAILRGMLTSQVLPAQVNAIVRKSCGESPASCFGSSLWSMVVGMDASPPFYCVTFALPASRYSSAEYAPANLLLLRGMGLFAPVPLQRWWMDFLPRNV